MAKKKVQPRPVTFNPTQAVTVYGTGTGGIKLGKPFNTTGAIANQLINKGHATVEQPAK
jgi:hypothetical protein